MAVLSNGAFCKKSRTPFYHFVPSLAAVTVVTSSYQTGNSIFHTKPPGTLSLLVVRRQLPEDEGVIFDHMSMRRCARYLCKHDIDAPTCQFRNASHTQKTHYVKEFLPTAAR